jgi:hypothetical protein
MKGWRDATHTTKLLVNNNVGFSHRSALSRVLQVCRNSPSTVTRQRGIFLSHDEKNCNCGVTVHIRRTH